MLPIVFANTFVGSTSIAAAGVFLEPINADEAELTIKFSDFPTEVNSGSVPIEEEKDKEAMTDYANISKLQADDIAVKAVPGHIVSSDLEDENGFLVWDVEMLTANSQKISLMIDAGNGRLLAVAPDN